MAVSSSLSGAGSTNSALVGGVPAGGFPAGTFADTAVASGVAMNHRNPVAVWIGLAIIIIGIYHLAWC